MKAFIQDRERLLDSTNDLLKTVVYADNLVKVIENTPKDKVFNIGVFGGWGTGKSSIIRTAQDRIEKAHNDVKFITYDAWKYANDSFRRMFLLKVQQELKMHQTNDMKRFYQAENAEQEPQTVLSVRGLMAIIVVIAVLLALLWLTPLSLDWKVSITTLGTLLSLVLALWNGCFYDLKLTISKPSLFAPEQFEACFKQMMSKCMKRKSWYQKIWSFIGDFVKTGKASIVNLEKLVIVIDNIDRCPSDMAYQLLTDIKTFLSDAEYNLVFIVPVDDEALKKHLFRKWNSQTVGEIDKEKEEFLRKFFNVSLRIKPHQETDLLHFAHEINKENNLNYSNETLAIVAKEFADNPRRIIQLLNNLSGYLTLYEDGFAKQYEASICAVLILQEVYPDYYKKAIKDLDTVIHFRQDETEKNVSLNAFMRVASIIFRRTPVDVLQRIFTNTSAIFGEIPETIKKAVRSYDSDSVIEYVSVHSDNKEVLLDYVLESLKSELKYGATSQATHWLVFISSLFKAEVFDSSRFSSIDITLSPLYKTAIPEATHYETICYMASQMNKYGISSLRDNIIGYLQDVQWQDSDHYSIVLSSYLSVFTDERDCNDIYSVVETYYSKHQIQTGVCLNEQQILSLFNDSFVMGQIQSLSSLQIDLYYNNTLWCISNNHKLHSHTFSLLFTKCLELFGNTRGKHKEDYLSFIDYLLPIFNNIETSSLNEEARNLYELFVGVRKMPNPAYAGYPQHDVKRLFLEEIQNDEIRRVVPLLLEFTRISGGAIDTSGSISYLYDKCQDAIINGVLTLYHENVSIASFASTLVDANDYASENVIELTKVLLTRQTDGSYLLDENELKSKVQNLVDMSSNNNVELLLSYIVDKDKFLSNIEAEYVASMSSDAVNKLPLSVSKHAVSTFNRSNADTYKNNFDYLCWVIIQGNASQKKEVVRLMKEKILLEDDIDKVVKVLNNLETEDQSMLKTLVGELESLKESERVSDDNKQLVEELLSKLYRKLR